MSFAGAASGEESDGEGKANQLKSGAGFVDTIAEASRFHRQNPVEIDVDELVLQPTPVGLTARQASGSDGPLAESLKTFEQFEPTTMDKVVTATVLDLLSSAASI